MGNLHRREIKMKQGNMKENMILQLNIQTGRFLRCPDVRRPSHYSLLFSLINSPPGNPSVYELTPKPFQLLT